MGGITQCLVRYDPSKYDVEDIERVYKKLQQVFPEMQMVCIPNDIQISFINQDNTFKIENIVKI